MKTYHKTGMIFLAITVSVLVLFMVFVVSSSSTDCIWSGTAVAWIDVNENASLDPGEILLEGVAMHVDDTRNSYIDVAEPVSTNPNGDADLVVWMPGCPKVHLEVYPEVPKGYRLTTDSRFEVEKDFWGTLDRETAYYFGFAAEN